MKRLIKLIPKQITTVLFFLNLVLFFIPNLNAENIIYGTPYYLQHMKTTEYLTFVNASYNGVTPNCATQKTKETAPTWTILGPGGSNAKNGTVVKSGDSVTVQIQGTTWANMYLSHSYIYSILQDQYQARLLSSATSTLWKMSGFDSTLAGYVPTATGGQSGWTSNIAVGTTLTTSHIVDLWSITYSPLDYCMVSGQFWYTTAGVSTAQRKTYPAALEGYGEAHTLNAWYSNLNSRGWKLIPAVVTPATPSPTTAFKWQLDTTTGNVWFWDKTKWNLASGDTFKQITVTSSGIVCALSTTTAAGGYAVKVRTGATTANPWGTGWQQLSGGSLSTMTANGEYIWGINSENNTFYITGIGTPSTAQWKLTNPPILLNNTKPLTVVSGVINGTDINGTTWTIGNGSTTWQMAGLTSALNAIGTTYTSANLGTSADAWPTQKTLMAIVKYTGFNNVNFVNNPSITNSIYTKIKGFYDTRTDATLSTVKDLLTAASGKNFLSSVAIAPATTSQTADITTWLTNVNNALAETTNKSAFVTALNAITGIKFLPETDNPLLQKLQALVDNTTYNKLTYLVDYPITTNSIYTKIDYFYKKRGTFPLTDIQKLLTNAKDKNFLSATQKTDLTVYSTQVAKEIAYYTTLKTTTGETSFIFDPSTVTNNTYAAISTAAYSDKWAVTTPNYIEVRFKAEAFSDIHIRFASSTNPTDYIQVIFGGNTNTKSWARYSIGETKTTIVPEVDNVIPTGVSDYWVKISGTTLTYGTGTNAIIGTATIPDAAPKNLKYVGFGGYTQRVFYQNISIKTDDNYAQYAETTRVNGILTGLATLTFIAPSTLYDVQFSALQTLATSVATNSAANPALSYTTDLQSAFWTALTNLHNTRPKTDKTKLTALKTWYATLINQTSRNKLIASDKNFTAMNSEIDGNITTIDQAAATAQLKADLNAALTNIGTNYTRINIGETGDAWPTKKTMFAIINNPAFDTTYQGANGGDLIYAKLIGFYNNRATIAEVTTVGLTSLSNGISGLFDIAQNKTFLSENQKVSISERIAIIGLEIGLTAAFNTLNSSTDKLAAIKTFLNNYATDTRNLRAKRANLK
ncbi:MAG: hypothetical protein WC192_05605 [Candidatus Babeliales bacterium]|jgi:hypothetical protein